MEEIVKILSIRQVTHNVKSFRITKPAGYRFEPGQATEVSINKEKWKEERRPFTFTALNSWDQLEFTIKLYKDHAGVTNELDSLQVGDELIIRDVWGAISYQGEGYFIAGGAGITPFIAILRQLKKDGQVGKNELFFSNRTSQDIILHEELVEILGAQAHFIVSEEEHSSYKQGHIDKEFLQKNIADFNRPFYVCGPDKMVSDINEALASLGARAEQVVFEK